MPRNILAAAILRKSARLEPVLQRRFSRKLKADGFPQMAREALLRITPDAAANLLAKGGAGKDFFSAVTQAGCDLAMLNVSPDRVLSALAEYGEIDDELRFAIILTLNHAYSEVREQEWRALHDLLRIGYSPVKLDLLLSSLLDSVKHVAGSAAAHLYLADGTGSSWELRASTAAASTSETRVSIRVSPGVVRELSLSTGAKSRILDRGWLKKWLSFWSLPMLREGLLKGVIQFAFERSRALLPREVELLNVAAERCLAAIERAQILEDIADREHKMRELARRMLQVEEIERRRISRELHDDAGQQLVVIRLQMEMIEQSLPPEAVELRNRLAEVRDITEKTILDMRRLIGDLSPAVLEQLGLAAAVRRLVKRLKDNFGGEVQLHITHLPALNAELQIVVYRLAQECLNNIARHSRAENVEISLTAVGNSLQLQVNDDGVGFDVVEAMERQRCFGLIGMRERVDLLGGNFRIYSTPKEGQARIHGKKSGTKINLMLPITQNSL